MRHHAGKAGRVDQHIAAPELLLDRGGSLVDLRGVLKRQAHCLVTAAFERGDDGIGAVEALVVADDNLGPGLGEKPRAGGADTARRARHYRDLAVETYASHRPLPASRLRLAVMLREGQRRCTIIFL